MKEDSMRSLVAYKLQNMIEAQKLQVDLVLRNPSLGLDYPDILMDSLKQLVRIHEFQKEQMVLLIKILKGCSDDDCRKFDYDR